MATRRSISGSSEGTTRHLDPSDIAAWQLGSDNESIELETRDHVHAASLAMATQASRYLDMVGRELDPRLYDQTDFLEAVQRMLIGSPRARLRVLAQSLDRPVTHGHRLIELVRRMPTYAEIRVQGSEHAQYNKAFLVVDRVGVVFREAAQRFEGTACFNDRRRAGILLQEFEQMWSSARPHPDQRRIHL